MRALRQADRDDHRQHFRRQSHGDRHREEERLVPVVFGQAVDHENQRHHHQHETDHQPGEFLHAPVEARLHLLAGEAAGHAGRNRSARRSQPPPPWPCRSPRSCRENRCSLRSNGTRLSRASGASIFSTGIDSPVNVAWMMNKSFAAISRTSAGIMSPADKFHDVAGHELAERYFLFLSVAHHRGRDADHGLEFGRRRVRRDFPERSAATIQESPSRA